MPLEPPSSPALVTPEEEAGPEPGFLLRGRGCGAPVTHEGVHTVTGGGALPSHPLF